ATPDAGATTPTAVPPTSASPEVTPTLPDTAPIPSGPPSYAGIENVAPAIARPIDRIMDGVSRTFGELFGIKPAQSEPLGVAQNNPTNIRAEAGNAWVGEIPPTR